MANIQARADAALAAQAARGEQSDLFGTTAAKPSAAEMADIEPAPANERRKVKRERLALRACDDAPVDIEQVRAYQIAQLGRSGGNPALLELLPLPKPSRGDWRYDRWSSLACLASQRRYERRWRGRPSMRCAA